MTDRYDLLVESMREASRVISIIFGVSLAALGVRWAIRLAPPRLRTFVQNLFDLWLVSAQLILFVISK